VSQNIIPSPDEDEQLPVAVAIEEAEVTCADDHTVYAALPQELSMFTNPSSLLDSFWLYLNYCFILCLVPFRIVRDKRCRFSVTVSTFQQVRFSQTNILLLASYKKLHELKLYL